MQGGLESDMAKGISAKAALGLYIYENIVRYVVQHTQNGNVLDTLEGIGPATGFRVLDVLMELGIDNPLCLLGIESGESPLLSYMGIYADYANNLATGRGDNAWFLGVKLGYKRVKNPGEWRIAYDYRDLESNSQLDVFPDSSFYGTGTGAYGHKIRLTYGLAKSTLEYFGRAVEINGTAKRPRLNYNLCLKEIQDVLPK